MPGGNRCDDHVKKLVVSLVFHVNPPMSVIRKTGMINKIRTQVLYCLISRI